MSESLIAATKRLAELDEKIMPGDLNVEYEMLSRMLEVLSQFQLGDEDRLSEVIRKLEDENAWWISDDEMDCLRRLLTMASLMEAEDGNMVLH